MATLVVVPEAWEREPLPRLLQDRLKLRGPGLGRLTEIGVTGLGSMLGGGFTGFIISTWSE